MLSKQQQTFVNNNKTATSVKFHSRSLNSFLFDRKTIWCFKNNYFVVILLLRDTKSNEQKLFAEFAAFAVSDSKFSWLFGHNQCGEIAAQQSFFCHSKNGSSLSAAQNSRANFWTNLRTRCCKRSLVLSAPIRVIKAPRVSCARKPKTVTLIPPILSLNELYVCMEPVIAYRSVW